MAHICLANLLEEERGKELLLQLVCPAVIHLLTSEGNYDLKLDAISVRIILYYMHCKSLSIPSLGLQFLILSDQIFETKSIVVKCLSIKHAMNRMSSMPYCVHNRVMHAHIHTHTRTKHS